MSKNKHNQTMKYEENDKVSLKPNLDIERKDVIINGKEEPNFMPNAFKWTSMDEQKIKTKEIEQKTDGKKK